MGENFLPANFIHDFIDEDLASGVKSHVQTRFPPEPNGYLHIGHAKAICIDFGTADKYDGVCNLRFDDTNPSKEDTEYADAIKKDIEWLGFEWANEYYASDYFDFLYDCAITLIKKGLAYVDDITPTQMREMRGTLTEPGRRSEFADRGIDENLDLFGRMRAGEFPDGAKVLRAKIDMASPNLNMRDPVMYRIAHVDHHRTGSKWCIYPMYDFAHPLSDAREGVTFSLCSLEFENHRPLYNWFVDNIGFNEPPRQIEFARLNLNYCVTSKRKCLELVERGIVSGWDDPRMVTLCGLRRRGCPPAAIRSFVAKAGIAKAYSIVDFSLLESCMRDELGDTAPRAMAVIDPIKLIIDNYEPDVIETLNVERHPDHPEMGESAVSFGRELYIERGDFMKEPPRKYYRLYPGNEVRLKGAYCVTCTSFDEDEYGNIVAVHAVYDPETRGGNTPDGRKVRGTIHWVSARDSVEAEVRLYGRLFTEEDPGDDYLSCVAEDSLKIIKGCRIDKSLSDVSEGDVFQFMRQGYFCADKDTRPGAPVFNLTVELNSSYGKK